MVVADLEAGIGTLTRLGDDGVDTLILVVEPTPKSIEVATRAAEVAAGFPSCRVVVVANQLVDDEDAARIEAAFAGHELVRVPYDPALRDAEREGRSPLDAAPTSPAVTALTDMAASVAAPLS